LKKFIEIVNVIQDRFRNLTAVQKRWIAVVCTVVFSVVLTFSVIMSLRGPVKEEFPEGPGRLDFVSPIPAEDLFLPDEPDYLPGVLLEREQRLSWTEEDAAEYWQDPLRFGEEQWREKIEAAIDEILERVP